MSKYDETVHLLVRYREPAGIDTIAEHTRLIASDGSVWFGKYGRGVGDPIVARLAAQIADNVPTHLYLAGRGPRGDLRFHRGEVNKLANDAPPADEAVLVPTYYRLTGSLERVGLWARLLTLERVPSSAVDRLVVVSSRRRVLAVMQSSATCFLVTERLSTLARDAGR